MLYPGELSDKRKLLKKTKINFKSGDIAISKIKTIHETGSKKNTIAVDCLRVLGIDPGSTKIGYGIISCKADSKELKVLGYGYIDVTNHKDQGQRLLQIHKDLKEIISIYRPGCMAIENVYFFKNLKTFTPVVQSKGVILFTACQAELDIYEYTPLQVKQIVSGFGKADKSFVQRLVKSSLNINSNIKPDDASDALAIALCYIRHLTHC